MEIAVGSGTTCLEVQHPKLPDWKLEDIGEEKGRGRRERKKPPKKTRNKKKGSSQKLKIPRKRGATEKLPIPSPPPHIIPLVTACNEASGTVGPAQEKCRKLQSLLQ